MSYDDNTTQDLYKYLPLEIVIKIACYLPLPCQYDLVSDTPVGRYLTKKFYNVISIDTEWTRYRYIDYEARKVPRNQFFIINELQQFINLIPFFNPQCLQIKQLGMLPYFIQHYGPLLSRFTSLDITGDPVYENDTVDLVNVRNALLTYDNPKLNIGSKINAISLFQVRLPGYFNEMFPNLHSIELEFCNESILSNSRSLTSLTSSTTSWYRHHSDLPLAHLNLTASYNVKLTDFPRTLKSLHFHAFNIPNDYDKIIEFDQLIELSIQINGTKPHYGQHLLTDTKYPKHLKKLDISCLLAIDSEDEDEDEDNGLLLILDGTRLSTVYFVNIPNLEDLAICNLTYLLFDNTNFPKSLKSLYVRNIKGFFNETCNLPSTLHSLSIFDCVYTCDYFHSNNLPKYLNNLELNNLGYDSLEGSDCDYMTSLKINNLFRSPTYNNDSIQCPQNLKILSLILSGDDNDIWYNDELEILELITDSSQFPNFPENFENLRCLSILPMDSPLDFKFELPWNLVAFKLNKFDCRLHQLELPSSIEYLNFLECLINVLELPDNLIELHLQNTSIEEVSQIPKNLKCLESFTSRGTGGFPSYLMNKKLINTNIEVFRLCYFINGIDNVELHFPKSVKSVDLDVHHLQKCHFEGIDNLCSVVIKALPFDDFDASNLTGLKELDVYVRVSD